MMPSFHEERDAYRDFLVNEKSVSHRKKDLDMQEFASWGNGK